MEIARKSWRNVAVIISLLTLITLLPAPNVFAQNANPGVIPPNAKPYGMTYGEWSAKWWHWALELPADQNPFFDVEGNCTNGANGQSGPVWFLTGVLNESGIAMRNCTIPVGKALFFPLLNAECSNVEAPPYYGGNAETQRACAMSFALGNLFAEVDGVAIQNLDRYVVQSPQFDFTLLANNVLGVNPGPGQSVSNGAYLMLTPLSPGSHTVHFGGTYTESKFTVDMTYHLTVAPPKSGTGKADKLALSIENESLYLPLIQH